MKARLIAAAMLALPSAAIATVAMEPLQAAATLHEAPSSHHQLFVVKFVLRQAPPDNAPPQIEIDQATPEIMPPSAGSVSAMLLGAFHRDPNMLICSGWGCENGVR
ncbi:MAG TPA: hypothetical protein VGU65_08375 [Frateuria sp.]|uniref:hypothetical protein n=1 Tax=Frateuria sp. TaxID=2211372 RepID=UPI002DE4AF4B|nr:hypothetical protein [Frateuria sp.]